MPNTPSHLAEGNDRAVVDNLFSEGRWAFDKGFHLVLYGLEDPPELTTAKTELEAEERIPFVFFESPPLRGCDITH